MAWRSDFLEPLFRRASLVAGVALGFLWSASEPHCVSDMTANFHAGPTGAAPCTSEKRKLACGKLAAGDVRGTSLPRIEFDRVLEPGLRGRSSRDPSH